MIMKSPFLGDIDAENIRINISYSITGAYCTYLYFISIREQSTKQFFYGTWKTHVSVSDRIHGTQMIMQRKCLIFITTNNQIQV